MAVPNHFAANLKKLREKKDFSRRMLAAQFKWVSEQNIRTWEIGHQPPFERLIEIAKYFDVSIDSLLKEQL